jgi:hypothetical protein
VSLEPPIATIVRATQVLDALGITYCIGGSLASSFYGIPRATNDVDIVVALRHDQIKALVAALEADVMIDADAAEAVAAQRSFNLIAFNSLDKVDLFVAPDQPWSRQQLLRRRMVSLSDEEASTIAFASPEDVVLSKLVWYRLGGEVSDRQWQDLLSVLMTQAATIDRAYLRTWANDLGVGHLLDRALAQSDHAGTSHEGHD